AEMQDLWEMHSFDDVQQLWGRVCSVPGRTAGRQHDDEEWYSLGLYLLALGAHRLLTYPFQISKGESPDFMLTWPAGKTTGLEITRATTKPLQQAMTQAEREFKHREAKAKEAGMEIIPLPAQQGVLVRPKEEPEPVITPLSEEGWLADQAVQEWCSLVCAAIEKKLTALPRFRSAAQHDLLINDD